MVILLPGGEAVVGKGLVDSAIAAMDHKIKELDRLTLNVYAHVMDRDEKENERLRALVNGESWPFGHGCPTGDPRSDPLVPAESDEARS